MLPRRVDFCNRLVFLWFGFCWRGIVSSFSLSFVATLVFLSIHLFKTRVGLS